MLSCNNYNAVDIMTLTITPLPVVDAGLSATICASGTHTLSGTQPDCGSILSSTSGDGTFNNPNSLVALYTPGSGDIATGSVMLTLTGFGGGSCSGETDVDQMTLTIDPMPTA
jgi:hypothetical protein